MLVLTTFDLDEHVFAAVEAGASGFLLKDVAPDDLAHAVRVVARGKAMLAPALIRRLLERFARPAPTSAARAAVSDLSEQEGGAARLVARGDPTRRSPRSSSSVKATVKPTCRGCSPSSACSTGCRSRSGPTSRGWSGSAGKI